MAGTGDILLNKPENSINPDEVDSQKKHSSSQLMQWLACISATLSMVATGTVFGWATTSLERLKLDGYAPFKINDDESSWIVSVTVIGTTAGSFLAAWVSEKFGRKLCLMMSSLFYILGWVTVIFAPNVEAIYLSRMILGFGVGVSYTTNPQFVSEVSDVNIRGALCTLIAVNVFTGSLFACSVGPYVSYRVFNIVLLSIPLIFIATFSWFPETAYYYATKKRNDEAMKTIAFFKGYNFQDPSTHPILKDELDEVLKNIGENEESSQTWKYRLRQLLQPNNRRGLTIVIGLILGQQLSGNYSTMQYLGTLFNEANIGIAPDVATIIVFAIGLISGTFSTILVERAGRRPLLMTSSVGSAITLGFLAVYLLLNRIGVDVSSFNLVPVFSVIAFQTAYQIGLGTLPNALIGELFPTNVKGIAGAIVTIADGLFGFVVSKLYQVIGDDLGKYAVYFFFAASCLVLYFFTFLYIPETKNKTFAEIQSMLSRENSGSHCYYGRKRKIKTDLPS